MPRPGGQRRRTVRVAPALALLPLLSACAPDARLVFTAEGSNWASALLLVHSPTGATLDAVDLLGGAPLSRPTDADDIVLLALFDRSLAALRLTAGEQRIAGTERGERPLPIPDELRASRETSWLVATEAERELFASVRLERPSASACVARRGCFDQHEEPLCVVPCPTPPDPEPPRLGEGPTAPAPPALTPCPPGFAETRPTRESAPITCEPLPGEGPGDCGAHEVVFPGEATCHRLGPACPSGRFADDLGEAPTLYVDPLAAAQGDGSLAAPLRSFAEARVRATAGSVIALAKGEHVGPLHIPAGVRVVGACVEETVIRPPASPLEWLALAEGPDAALERVRLLPSYGGAAGAGAGVSLELRHVRVSGGSGPAVVAARDGAVRARELVLQDGPGAGLAAEARGSIEGAFVSVHRRGASGVAHAISLDASATATLTDVLVFEPENVCFSVTDGARVELRRALLHGCRGTAIEAAWGGRVTASDLVVRASRLNEGGSLHELRGAVRLSRGWIQSGGDVVFFGFEGTQAALEDLVIEGLEGLVDERTGLVTFGDGFTVKRLWLGGEFTDGVVFGGGSASFEDLRIAGRPTWASGITAGRSTFTLARTYIEGPSSGLRLVDSNVTLGDLRVELPSPDEGGQSGLDLVSTALELERGSLRGGRHGLLLNDTGPVRLRDVEIRETVEQGLSANESLELSLERVEFSDLRTGAMNISTGSTLRAIDLLISNVEGTPARLGCNAPRCSGTGLFANTGGQLVAERFLVRGCRGFGLRIESDGAIELSDGEVRESGVGAVATDPDFDTARILERVLYRDNGTDWASGD